LPACALALLAALLWAAPVAAVVDIRHERWTQFSRTVPRDLVAPVDSVAGFIVEFDATSTAGDGDPLRGVRFAIAERDAGGNDVLVRFEVRPCTALPAAGSALALRAVFDLYCDVDGNLIVRDGIQWLVNWCDRPQAQACASDGLRLAAEIGSSAPEDWELVVLDENDEEGSFPTPDDIVACGPIEPLLREFVAPEFDSNGFIGIYADTLATVCSAQVTPLQPFRWYVIASLAGLARCGLTVLELGIEGLPPNFFVQAEPHANAVAFGDPFASGGLAFPCESGSADRVVLYTLNGFTTEPAPNAVMRVGAGQPPSNRFWAYPWIELCPQFLGLRRRMLGRAFEINPGAGGACPLPTTIAPATWSAVKSLYRG
jgi:hypothetical protein